VKEGELKISSAIVGRGAGPAEEHIDLRWLMAYNAALGELSEAAHPLFAVCYEWPVNRVLREAAGLQALNERLVHAQHDLVIHRAPRAGEALRVTGRVVGVAQRRPGAFVVMRMETRGAGGEPVTTTDYGMLYRGVTLEGGARAVESLDDPPSHREELNKTGEIPIAATAAHVYTECARIWNPIHTDPAYARAAGLPGIILHGTATLGLSVSHLLGVFGVKRPSRIRCRFAGMVLMPSTLAVHASRVGDEILFETRNADDKPLLERGRIDLA
jgi:acyl dehydratase